MFGPNVSTIMVRALRIIKIAITVVVQEKYRKLHHRAAKVAAPNIPPKTLHPPSNCGMATERLTFIANEELITS